LATRAANGAALPDSTALRGLAAGQDGAWGGPPVGGWREGEGPPDPNVKRLQDQLADLRRELATIATEVEGKRRRSRELRLRLQGSGPAQMQPARAPPVEVSKRLFSNRSLQWDAGLDASGFVRRFPIERDDAGRELPLLLAAFDRKYLAEVILLRVAAGIREFSSRGGTSAVSGADPARGLLECANADDDTALRREAIHLYTREGDSTKAAGKLYQEVNRLMRLDFERNEPEAALWPFVALLQMALVKREKDPTGGDVFRGRLIEVAELDRIRREVGAGREATLVLRGITSCSRSEKAATNFVRRVTPTATLVRVVYQIKLDQILHTEARRNDGLSFGAAAPMEYLSAFSGEKEVVLLEGTVLHIKGKESVSDGSAKYGVECVLLRATVNSKDLLPYFDLCSKAVK
jgi:hypothetical protein